MGRQFKPGQLQTGSLYNISASYAVTASYAVNGGGSGTNIDTGSFATTGSNVFIGNQTITGSLLISGSTTQVGINNLLGQTNLSGSIYVSGSMNALADITVAGTLRLDPAQDPGNTNATASFLFTSASNTEQGYDLYYRQDGNLVKFKWLEGGISSGLLYGGKITSSGSVIYVTSGSGIILDPNATFTKEINPQFTYVTWANYSASATYLTSSQNTYIYVDSAGTIHQQTNFFDQTQYEQAIPLGRVTHPNYISITGIGSNVQTTYDSDSQQSAFIRAFGPLKVNGFSIQAHAGSLSFGVGSGIAYTLGGFYSQDPNSPSHYQGAATPTASIARAYRSGSGVRLDNNNGAFYTTVDPDYWDDGTGVLNTMAAGDWQIQRVFFNPVSGRSTVYYGQTTYTTLLNALQYLATDSFTEGDFTANSLIFIGYLVLKGQTNNIADTNNNRVINGGIFRNIAGGSSGAGAVAQNLNDLSDVTITTPSNGQSLVYNSGTWENGTPILASTASYVLQAVSASYAPDTTFPYTGSAIISGSLRITGSLNVSGSITGSLLGTASWAASATSAPLYLPLAGGNMTGTLFGAGRTFQFQDLVLGYGTTFGTIKTDAADGTKYIGVFPHASFETTRFLGNGNVMLQQAGTYTDKGYRLQVSASTSVSGAFLAVGNSVITGSLKVTAGITGSLFGTASWATNAITASYALDAVSSSFASTAQTASYVFLAVSASSAVIASDATSISSAIVNNIDNRILTATGGGTINGEGNLTFNGQALAVTNGFISFSGSNSWINQSEGGTANSSYAYAQGINANAFGAYSHAEGSAVTASGYASHAEGSGSATSTFKLYGAKANTITSGVFQLDGDVTTVFQPGNRLYYNSIAYPDNTTFIVDTSVFGGVNTNITLTNTSITDSNFVVGSLDYTYTLWAGNLSSVSNGGHAEGWYTNAIADWSHTEGYSTQTFGRYSHAEGSTSQAIGVGSHAEGSNTNAIGEYSHAEGRDATASGSFSHAEGFNTQTLGQYSHAEGLDTQATGIYSHAEGRTTLATAEAAHAEGHNTTASGSYSHAEGQNTNANGQGSHAEGFDTLASGAISHTEGEGTVAYAAGSHAEGAYTTTFGAYSHTEGYVTQTGFNNGYLATITNPGDIILDSSYGDISTAGIFGAGTYAALDDRAYNVSIPYAVINILSCSFDGTNTHIFEASGVSTTTLIVASISNISSNTGTYEWGGYTSHAEGYTTNSPGDYSHAEGTGQSYGSNSHAEGTGYTYAANAHAEANGSTFGDSSHAEGSSTTFAASSHAEGASTAGYFAFAAQTTITSGVFEIDGAYGDVTSQFPAGAFILIDDGSGEINGTASTYKYEVASSTFNATPATEITLVDTTVNTVTNKYQVGIYGSPLPIGAPFGQDGIGLFSHAEGESTETIGRASNAAGFATKALGWYQAVVGQYNQPISTPGAFIVGDGIDDGIGHNLLVAAAGSVTISGSLQISGSILPAVSESVTSSFSLGSATQAWKDIWVANGSINMVDATGSIQTSITSNASGVALTGSLYGTVSSIVKGEATIDFGATPGSNYTTTTISTPNVTNNSNIHIYIMSTASADHNAIEHQIFSLYGTVMPDNIIDNTSFDIVALSQLRLDGTFKVRYTINNN